MEERKVVNNNGSIRQKGRRIAAVTEKMKGMFQTNAGKVCNRKSCGV